MSTSAQSATPGLAHRSISNIRSGAGPQAGPPSPHTPLRGTTSAFGSPSTLRAEEETIVIEIGTRFVRIGVYEYREIRHTRSTRSGKMLVHEVHELLASARKRPPTRLETSDADGVRRSIRVFGFDECEDIACRMTWCQQLDRAAVPENEPGLATVEERDEFTSLTQDEVRQHHTVRNMHLGMSSCSPPEIIELPFQRLSEPCENTFVAPQYTPSSFDDDELPIPLLIYRHLLSLPIDARAVSMSRIIFTGGCSNIPGLRKRLSDELSRLVGLWGWDPVHGDGAQQVKAKAKHSKSRSRAHAQAAAVGEDGQKDDVWHDAANAVPEHDSVQQLLQRTGNPLESLQGSVRVLETLGPWAGASMIAHLKAMAVANIDREAWLQQGVAGATRPGEVDVKAQQRQSLGPGLMRGASVGGSASWTLGAWGAV
ncbi:conserved hypothetical protein [Verticillium alfalfae VaMs.102]|uniref:Actin-like ATPase domain-containing protein n=1 Tax=Verticillium alfalfae (strain VaMs.102 / ATCC MYA-4576 / FGSC 10136) TaxID=526221 RepID=C9SAA6_VERA1|nr:conserved hypothetical protein [Verticillium alfalfae VaMs.102]EEY15383.1 conserved hypothetical protein [Verticillium alfalfae VaMs.102]